MPIVHIYLLKGRSQETLKRLIESVTKATSESLGVDPQRVTVVLHELPPENWAKGGITLKEQK
jgi:4-oxalocrotonate tautomerase